MVKFDDGTTDFHTPMDIPPPDTMNTEALDTPKDQLVHTVMAWIAEDIEVTELHMIPHEHWQKLYARLQQYVDSECKKARINELQSLIMTDLPENIKAQAFVKYKKIESRIEELNTGGNKGE